MNKGFEILKERRCQLLKLVLREGSEVYLLDTKIYNASGTQVDSLEDSYSTNLNDIEDGCYDIMKIFRCDGKLLWERHRELPKLSPAERTILENIPMEWKYIARDEDGNLYIYKAKPFKENNMWYSCGSIVTKSFSLFNQIFEFIEWTDSEPYCIQELLEV